MNAKVNDFQQQMDTAQKRHLISSVLAEYFKPDQLYRIMQVWEANFSQKPIFVLQQFIAYSCHSEGVDMKPSLILKALVARINQEQSDLKTRRFSKELSSLQKAYYLLIETAVSLTPTQDREKIQASFLKAFAQDKTEDLLEFTLWVERKLTEKPALSQATMKKLVMECYLALCNYLGAPQADSIYDKCIKHCHTKGFKKEINQLI